MKTAAPAAQPPLNATPHRPAPADPPPRWGRWLLGFGLAFFVLNALLTFENRWPTAGVRFGPRLSFELCGLVLGLLLWTQWRGRVAPRALSVLALLYVGLVLARYVDVTAAALFGRPLNLYWDGRHGAELLRLAASTLPGWQVGAALAALALGLAGLYGGTRWAIGRIADGLTWHRPRPALLLAGAALGVSFAVHPYVERDTRWFFALPVSPTLAHQARLLPSLLWPAAAGTELPAGPAFDTDLAALRGADVLLLFAESYGASTLDRPEQAQALAAPRARLAQALQASGRQVVSARLRSPTFGGASWLAHAALLSGLDMADPDDHDRLLASDRPTLVSHFARHGYRTVGWMPGLQKPWPEGAFYGYERIADANTVGYRGPAFGYWRVPDQAALALLQAQELQPGATPRPPRFVVFPTVSTHAPFVPLAPIEPDWTRLLRDEAYDAASLARALAEPVSWRAPTPAYLRAMAYGLDTLAGYLAGPAPAGLLTIVVGDHQPLAAVSGSGASWDVPVHVISRDAALLRRFEAAGFAPGLLPPAASWGAMHDFTGLLLRSLHGSEAATAH